jgi:hypothetical protein
VQNVRYLYDLYQFLPTSQKASSSEHFRSWKVTRLAGVSIGRSKSAGESNHSRTRRLVLVRTNKRRAPVPVCHPCHSHVNAWWTGQCGHRRPPRIAESSPLKRHFR